MKVRIVSGLLLGAMCAACIAPPSDAPADETSGRDASLDAWSSGDMLWQSQDAGMDSLPDTSDPCDQVTCGINEECVSEQTTTVCVCQPGHVRVRPEGCAPEFPGLADLAQRCMSASTPLPTGGKTVDAGIGKGLDFADRPGRTNTVMLTEAPAVLDQDNTRYVLTADVTVDDWAFEITGNFITLDLDGHTLTYGNADATDSSKVHAVRATEYQTTHIAIINGTIEKGPGACDSSDAGSCSAVYFGPYFNETVEVAGLEIVTRGKAASAIHSVHVPLHAHHLLIRDETQSDGDNEYAAINHAGDKRGRIHDNHITGSPKRAIRISKADVYDNVIDLESGTASSYGIVVDAGKDYSIHDNEIHGTGVNPIGIGTDYQVGAGEVFSNYVDVENSSGSENRGSICLSLDSGDGIDVSCNWLQSRAGGHFGLVGTSSNWGSRSWGRCLRVSGNAAIHDNFVRAHDVSGQSHAIAVATNRYRGAGEIQLFDNLILSTTTHLFFQTEELPDDGHMLVDGNSFIREKVGNRYRFIRHDHRYAARARIVGNTTGEGVDPANYALDFCEGPVDLGIGAGADVEYWLTNDPTRALHQDAVSIQTCGYRIGVAP